MVIVKYPQEDDKPLEVMQMRMKLLLEMMLRDGALEKVLMDNSKEIDLEMIEASGIYKLMFHFLPPFIFTLILNKDLHENPS